MDISELKIYTSFAYREFYIALAYQNKAENMENPVEKHELWDKAIERYGKAIDYNPNFHPAYAKSQYSILE